MNTTPTALPTSIDSLLAHADWVRALARHLAGDPETAHDVEQEVWREAIEHPPAHASNPRGWLAEVARNAARQLRRGDVRRKRRDQSAARPEALPSTQRLVEEAALSRELAGVVLQLDEPYRTTLLLRYFRELSIDDIATAQSVSRETVRTRQRRGLEMLRERLDTARGGRAAWMSAFAVLIPSEARPVAAGGGLAGLGWILAAAVVVVGTVLWAWKRDTTAPQVAALQPAAVERPSAPASATPPASTESARSPLASRVEESPGRPGAIAPHSPPSESIQGHVIDLQGRPMASIDVVLSGQNRTMLRDGVLYLVDPPHTKDGAPVGPEGVGAGGTVYSGTASIPIPPDELELIRKNPEALELFVQQFGDPKGLRDVLLGRSVDATSTRTDSNGAFTAELPEGNWQADVRDPHATIVAEIGARKSANWTLVVAPSVRVSGIVVDETGKPIEGATIEAQVGLESLRDFDHAALASSVSMRGFRTQTNAHGEFEVLHAPRAPLHALHAYQHGHDEARVPVPDSDTSDVRIVLPHSKAEEVAHLRGLVLDAQGNPAADVGVQLGQDNCTSDENGRFDMTLSCCHGNAPLTAVKRGFQAAIVPGFGRERMTSQDDIVLRLGPSALSIRGHVTGPMGKPIAGAHVQILDGTAYGTTQCFLEDVAVGNYQLGVRASNDGGFEIGGLLDRTYRLAAWWDEERVVITGPIQAGTSDLVLEFEPADVIAEVRGRVVTRHGEGVPDARIALSLPTWKAHGSTSSRNFGHTTTDERGNFTLRDVPKDLVALSISGQGLRSQTCPMPPDPAAGVTITATLQVRVILEVADATVDEVWFLDADGRQVTAWLHLPGTISGRNEVPRREGVFPPFELSDDAVTAVLRAGDKEIHRAPIDLRRTSTLRLQL